MLFVVGKIQGCQLKTVQIDAYPRLFPTPFRPLFSFAPHPSPTLPTPPSSSKTTCTFFLMPLSSVLTVTNFFSGGVSQREGCTLGERKGERRGRDLHKEREREKRGGGGWRRRRRREKEGVVRQGEGGREAQREGQNSEEGGDQEGGSLCLCCLVPPESPLLYGKARSE